MQTRNILCPRICGERWEVVRDITNEAEVSWVWGYMSVIPVTGEAEA